MNKKKRVPILIVISINILLAIVAFTLGMFIFLQHYNEPLKMEMLEKVNRSTDFHAFMYDETDDTEVKNNFPMQIDLYYAKSNQLSYSQRETIFDFIESGKPTKNSTEIPEYYWDRLPFYIQFKIDDTDIYSLGGENNTVDFGILQNNIGIVVFREKGEITSQYLIEFKQKDIDSFLKAISPIIKETSLNSIEQSKQGGEVQ